MNSTFVLIHSPLVGPFTWALVADELWRRGTSVVVPALLDDPGSGRPFWEQHVQSVASAIGSVPAERPLVLVAHSGAGALLPAVRQLSGRPVAAYVFADARVPNDGEPRLGPAHAPDEFARQVRPLLDAGGSYPSWSDTDLAEIVPDAGARRGLLAELRPRSLAFWTEPIPVFAGWPDAPCAVLQFSPAYDAAVERARRDGWRYRRLEGGHFHMLVDPASVAGALLELSDEAP